MSRPPPYLTARLYIDESPCRFYVSLDKIIMWLDPLIRRRGMTRLHSCVSTGIQVCVTQSYVQHSFLYAIVLAL